MSPPPAYEEKVADSNRKKLTQVSPPAEIQAEERKSHEPDNVAVDPETLKPDTKSTSGERQKKAPASAKPRSDPPPVPPRRPPPTSAPPPLPRQRPARQSHYYPPSHQYVPPLPPIFVGPPPVIMSPYPYYYDTCVFDPYYCGYYGGYGYDGFDFGFYW